MARKVSAEYIAAVNRAWKAGALNDEEMRQAQEDVAERCSPHDNPTWCNIDGVWVCPLCMAERTLPAGRRVVVDGTGERGVIVRWIDADRAWVRLDGAPGDGLYLRDTLIPEVRR